MTTKGRGRNFTNSPNVQALRRPGEAGLLQRLSNLSPTETNDIEIEVTEVCEEITTLNVDSVSNLSSHADKIKKCCQKSEDIEKCVLLLFNFALKSKWNAHTGAILCSYLADVSQNDVKFRTCLLRKLQATYKERNKRYLHLDDFLMDVAFLCEIYHHVRIEGVCLKVLSRPIIDYFIMLVDNASEKEVEVFYEQFPKCYTSLKESDEDGLEMLLSKLRKQIVCGSSVTAKAMLLEIFENILTDFQPLSENAKNLYQSLSKQILKICT